MEKSAKLVGQIYGYFICLTAIILFLTSVQSIVGSLVDLGNPKFAADLAGSNLESFEKYKMNVMNSLRAAAEKRRPEGSDGSDPAADVKSAGPPYVPDDAGLRTMYEAERTNRFDSARHVERRRIVENSLMGCLSVGLFVIHWLWLRKRPRSTAKAA
ncbi:MAG: hypothetical protein ACM31I_03880 [Deltaproteobacteria bacterium]